MGIQLCEYNKTVTYEAWILLYLNYITIFKKWPVSSEWDNVWGEGRAWGQEGVGAGAKEDEWMANQNTIQKSQWKCKLRTKIIWKRPFECNM